MGNVPLSHDPAERVELISILRTDIATVIENVDRLIASISEDRHPCGREIALVKTKLQEARMWAGQGLSHFPTGFVPSDQPGKPETVSKLAA